MSKVKSCPLAIAPGSRPLLATENIAKRTLTADVSLLHRIHPGIYVCVPLAVCFPGQVDGHLAYLSIGWDPCSLVANILGDKVRSQLGKTTLAPARHSVRSPAAADSSTMSTVCVEHVRKGLGGVALDVAPVASATPKTYSHRHAGKAKDQDQLERHPGARDPKPQSSWLPLF